MSEARCSLFVRNCSPGDRGTGSEARPFHRGTGLSRCYAARMDGIGTGVRITVTMDGAPLLDLPLIHAAIISKTRDGQLLSFLYRVPVDPEDTEAEEVRPLLRAELMIRHLGEVPGTLVCDTDGPSHRGASMTLDKWQQREAAQHARDNDVPEEEAVAELFPAEAEPEAPARRALSTERTDGDDGQEPKDPEAPKAASGSRARSTK